MRKFIPFALFLLYTLSALGISNAFITPSRSNFKSYVLVPNTSGICQKTAYCNSQRRLQPIAYETYPTTLLAETTWRQYVSLAVILGVLLDIILGSPVANMVTKPLRDAQEAMLEEDGTEDRSKERVDTKLVAQEALDRAEGALALRNYLEQKKTDWDRMEEMKRKFDSDMDDLDADLKAREQSLAKRRLKE